MRIPAVTMLLAAALTLVPTGAFQIDPAHSRVEFFIKDNRGGFTGVVRDIDASARVREQGGSFAADVEAQIDARSITTGIGIRDAQMRREALETGTYPFITFVGTATPAASVGGLPFRVVLRGRLSIKQTTREVEIPVRVTALRDAYLAEGQVTIRPSDFKVSIPRFLVFVAEDAVTISLRVRFREKSP